MPKKNKKIDKNLALIIIAIIGIIPSTMALCISCADSSEAKLTTNESESNSYMDNKSENVTENEQKSITENISKDKSENQLEPKNQLENSGENPGIIFVGDNLGELSLTNYANSDSNNEKQHEEKVTLTGEMNKTIVHGDNNEIIDTYFDEKSIPVFNFRISNENTIAINIINVFVKVTNCKIFNEYVDNNNVIPPNCNAGMIKKIFWSCNVNPKYEKYYAELLGNDKNNTEDLSESEYVEIKSLETGEFQIKIYPDIPGEYKFDLIVEYSSYEGEIKELILPDMNFSYKPDHNDIDLNSDDSDEEYNMEVLDDN